MAKLVGTNRKTTLEMSGEYEKLHSKRVGKIEKFTRFECVLALTQWPKLLGSAPPKVLLQTQNTVLWPTTLVKNTLETSGKDVKITLETSGEDVKNTLGASAQYHGYIRII